MMSRVTNESDEIYAVDSVLREIENQHTLRNQGRFANTPDSPWMSDDEFLRVLVEEVGEVARAIHEREGDDALYKEITQVAAIAANRMMGMHASARVP